MMATQGVLPQLPVMPFRMTELEAAVAGFDATGVPLVARSGGALRAAGVSDDPGIYAIVPWVARATDLAPAQAANVLLLGIALVGAIVGLAGLLVLFRRPLARAYAVGAAALVAALGVYVGDIYVVAPALAFAFVPWFLIALRRGGMATLAAMLAVGGVAMGWAHALRSHSATGLLVFVAIMLLLERGVPRRRRAAAAVALTAGLLASGIWMSSLIARRDVFLSARVPGYVTPEPRHPFWHSVYIGLGYTDNPYVPAYRDEVAMARVEALRPGTPFLSPAYEATLRDEVVRIAVAHPLFFAQNVAAKVGVVAFFALIFANLGVVAAARARPPMPATLALLAGAAFNTLFGILVVPILPYLSGLAAFVVLLAALTVDAWAPRRAGPRAAVALAEPR